MRERNSQDLAFAELRSSNAWKNEGNTQCRYMPPVIRGSEHRTDTMGSDIRGTEHSTGMGRLNTHHTLFITTKESHLLDQRG